MLVEEAEFDELFDQRTATTLREMLLVESPTDGSCTAEYLTLTSHTGEDRPPTSIEELAQSATSIVSGVVVEGQPGFLRGQPGTRYEFRVERWLRKSDAGRHAVHHETGSTVHFFYAAAKMHVEGRHYCFETGRGFERPQVGRRVALFLDDRNPTPAMQRVFNHQIVFETESGDLDAPTPALAQGLEFSEFLTAIEIAISERWP
ncbi:MAG: hypothetical protein AAGC60_00610 [Acidobacteriota bacterium]